MVANITTLILRSGLPVRVSGGHAFFRSPHGLIPTFGRPEATGACDTYVKLL